MRLANAAAYHGVLKLEKSVRAHVDDDPEIVLIDVDGLGDLATVRARTERSGGGSVACRGPAEPGASRLPPGPRGKDRRRRAIQCPGRGNPGSAARSGRRRTMAPESAPFTGSRAGSFPLSFFDLVEDTGRRWMGQASAGGGRYKVNGLRLFTVAITRAQSRLYLIGSGTQISAAPDGTPLAQIARMLRARLARSVSATALITPTLLAGTDVPPLLGPFSSELAEILAQHVHVADIHDERSFYDVFAGYLNSARNSIWIWAPWTATRVRSLLPVLADAADRGVRITLFVRDPRDTLQGRAASPAVSSRSACCANDSDRDQRHAPENRCHRRPYRAPGQPQHTLAKLDARGHASHERVTLRSKDARARTRNRILVASLLPDLQKHANRSTPQALRRMVLAMPQPGLPGFARKIAQTLDATD